jgi:hypothetical protein
MDSAGLTTVPKGKDKLAQDAIATAIEKEFMPTDGSKDGFIYVMTKLLFPKLNLQGGRLLFNGNQASIRSFNSLVQKTSKSKFKKALED